MGTVLIPRKLVAFKTALVTWFCSISGIGGVAASATEYALACADACRARFWAWAAVVRNHTTIGMVAWTARSLAAPLHTAVRLASAPASSSACVSSRIAMASQPAAA